MLRLLAALLPTVRSAIRSRRDLLLENLALRQQLATLVSWRSPEIRTADRAFWVALRRLWPGWARVLVIVQPDRSFGGIGGASASTGPSCLGAPVGRAALPCRARFATSSGRWLLRIPWGAPRIHGELPGLDFDVFERTVSRYVRSLRRSPRPAGRIFSRTTVAASRRCTSSPCPPRPSASSTSCSSSGRGAARLVRSNREPNDRLGRPATARGLPFRGRAEVLGL
jgi:hypothetical protein